MKLSNILNERELSRLLELEAPVIGAAPAGTAPAPGTTTLAPTQQVQNDPAAQAKMMAQQALNRQNQRKQLQDQIKAKQQEIADAQKALAELQKQLATVK